VKRGRQSQVKRTAPDLRPAAPGGASRIVQDFLHVLRNQFYADDTKGFFQQRWLLVRGICHPAKYLADRGVGLTEADHRKLLTDQIRAIQHHGSTSSIRFFGRYWLHVVQEHMKHHGEDYYDSGKKLRQVAEAAVDSIRASAATQALEVTDRLSEIATAVRPPARRKKRSAPAGPAVQEELF
jgi:hypothetical protein